MTASAIITWGKTVKDDGPGENYLIREFSKLFKAALGTSRRLEGPKFRVCWLAKQASG